MSLTKSTTRRAALLSGASLVAAAASLGAVLTPTTAAAQVTCVAGTAVTGNGTGTVTIAGGTSNPGVTCTYTGAATVTTLGSLTVSSAGGVPGDPLVNGVNLVGGSQAITWVSTAGTVTGGAQTNGPVIAATTTSGAINITTAGVTGSNATVTHGIMATSASGNIDIATSGTVSAANTTSGDTAIWAETGGSGDVTLTTGGNTTGRLYGVYAEVAGGDLVVNVNGSISSNGPSTASAGIQAVGGAGSTITINLPSGFSGSVSSSSGAAIRTQTAGDAVINIAANADGSGGGRVVFGLVDMEIAGGTTTLNLAAYGGPNQLSGIGSSGNGPDARLEGRLRGSGAGDFVANINGRLRGGVDFGGLSGGPALTGEATLNLLHNGAWYIDGAAVHLGNGDSTVITALGGEDLGYEETGVTHDPLRSVGGRVHAGSLEVSGVEPVHIIDFGAGDDLFDNGGYFLIGGPGLFVGAPYTANEAEVRLANLETFVNRGVVVLGAYGDYAQTANFMGSSFHMFLESTDEWHDDILSMPGTTLAGSRVVDADGETMIRWNGLLAVGEFILDVDTLGAQADCVRDATTGDLDAADCLILDGGATDATENPVYIRIIEPVPGDRGTLNSAGIVLVDMGATGTSAQGDVAISPNQAGYNPLFGGFMDKGAFAYVIAFDESTNQHKLFSGASQHTAQFPLIAQSAHALWRTSTGTWFDRQADLRNDPGDNIGGVWGRITAEQAERETDHVISFVGQDFAFDNSYEQKSYAVTGGFDLLFGGQGDTTYLAGVTLGYAHAELAWEASPNEARLEAWTGGAYASFVSGGVFVDAAINAHNGLLRYDAPAMNLFPAGSILDTDLMSVGGQVEAGWRIPMIMNGAFVEPLAGLSYVRTKYDDLEIPADDPGRQGVTVEFDDPTSLRAGLGARAGLDQDFGGVRAQFSGLVRLWNEFEDETSASLINPGATGTVTDEFTGQFTEVGVGASVYSAGGLVSGFVNLGGRVGDDYQATTAAAGVRVNW